MASTTIVSSAPLEQLEQKLDALAHALTEERAALEAQTLDTLLQCTDTKQQLLQDVEQSPGLAELTALRDAVAGDTADDAGRALLSRIGEKLQSCRDINEINGRIIATQARFNARLLNIMFDRPVDGAVYDRCGRDRVPPSSHSLATI